MPFMPRVVETAPELAAGIARDWNSRRGVPMWLNVPRPVDENGLAELIRSLGESADGRISGDTAPSIDVIRAAVHHGRQRRAAGFTDEMLLHEYHLLRRELWEQLKRDDPERASATILRLDAEITTAMSASLHGFHVGASSNDMDDETLVSEIAKRWTP